MTFGNSRRHGGVLPGVVMSVLAFAGGAAVTFLLYPRLAALIGSRPEETAGDRQPAEPTRIQALGRVLPRDGKFVGLVGPPGERVGEYLNAALDKAGAAVKQGDELVRLSGHKLAAAQVGQLEKQIKRAEKTHKAAIDAANAQVSLAQTQVNEYSNALNDKDSPQNMLQRQTVAALQKKIAFAEREVRRLQQGGVPAQQIAQQRFQLSAARNELAATRLQQQEAENRLRSKLDVARQESVVAQKNLARLEAEDPVATLEDQLETAKLKLAELTLKAPIAGVTLEKNLATGEAIGREPILVIADTDTMMVRAEVYETQLPWLRKWGEGTKVEITSPVFERAGAPKVTGTVKRIGRQIGRNEVFPVNPAEDLDRRVAEAWVVIDPEFHDLAAKYLRLQVTVTIPNPGG